MIRSIIFVIGNILLYVFFKTGRMDIFLFYCGVIPFASYYYLRRTSLGKPGIWMVLTCLIAFLPSLVVIAIDLHLSKPGFSFRILSEYFILASGTMLAGLIVGWLLYVSIRKNDVKDGLFAGIALLIITSSSGALGFNISIPLTGVSYFIVTYSLIQFFRYNLVLAGLFVYLPYLLLATIVSYVFFDKHPLAVYIDLIVPLSILFGGVLSYFFSQSKRLQAIILSVFFLLFYFFVYIGIKTMINKQLLASIKPFNIYNESTFKSAELQETLRSIPENKGCYYFFYIYKTRDTAQFKVLESIDSIKKSLELNASLVMLNTSQKNESNVFNEKADYFMNEFSAHIIEVSADQSEKLENLLNIKAYPHISVTNDSLRILFNDQLISKRQIDSLVTKVVRYSKR
jgi:hypothetical protein